ncbi:MAG TPA: universal stress protein [Acidimicrobiia bacterium]
MTWDASHIVAAVDGSDSSLRAARAALELARSSEGEVTLITVVRPPEGYWGIDGAPPSPEAMAAAIVRARTEVLDAALKALETDGLTVNTVEEIGDPATSILNHCAEAGTTVLFVGRRGSGFVERLMLGSVADRLAHNSPCPVVIVP